MCPWGGGGVKYEILAPVSSQNAFITVANTVRDVIYKVYKTQ